MEDTSCHDDSKLRCFQGISVNIGNITDVTDTVTVSMDLRNVVRECLKQEK